MASTPYEFTTDWFGAEVGTDYSPYWRSMKNMMQPPRKVLEIGSFEGRSSTFMVEMFAEHGPFELVCIDSWGGAIEHQQDGIDFDAVEKRFDANIQIALENAPHPVSVRKLKGSSVHACAKLIADGEMGTFDWIYVDGSHQAVDVLCDAVMAFQLLSVGGMLIFDDYLWDVGYDRRGDTMAVPKPAIDAFTNIFYSKLTTIRLVPLYQYCVTKTSD